MLRKGLAVMAAGVLVLLGASRASALPIITVDEDGHGLLDFGPAGSTPMPGVLARDPGPGGLASVLTYDLLGPPALTAGDVLLRDSNGMILDVVRFNPAGTGSPSYRASLLFYSDNLDGFDDEADTPGPPTLLYTNFVIIPEVGMEGGGDGAIYTPRVGQPGFVPGFAVTYNLISDSPAVPEPTTMLLLGTGLIVVGSRLRKSRATK
jgi:hypothetical protein